MTIEIIETCSACDLPEPLIELDGMWVCQSCKEDLEYFNSRGLKNKEVDGCEVCTGYPCRCTDLP